MSHTALQYRCIDRELQTNCQIEQARGPEAEGYIQQAELLDRILGRKKTVRESWENCWHIHELRARLKV